jgi:hypothetical protein
VAVVVIPAKLMTRPSLRLLTILGVVTIMAMPEIAGVLAGGAALNYFLGYSIMGKIIWGAGHLLVC